MSPKEILLYRITELMFEKQQTFVLLDELYQDEVISPFVRNIQIDSPYQQLVFDGVLSQYNHQNEIVVSFTIEAYFQHILANMLEKDKRYNSSESLITLLKENRLKGLPEAVSNLMSFDVEKENLDRLTGFIDLTGMESITLDLCVTPVIHMLKVNGEEKTIKVILEHTSENDWEVIAKIIEQLELLELFDHRSKLLFFISSKLLYNSYHELLIGITICQEFDISFYKQNISVIEICHKNFSNDFEMTARLAQLHSFRGNYDKAKMYFQKCIKNISSIAIENRAIIYNELGVLAFKNRSYKSAEKYFFKSIILNEESKKNQYELSKTCGNLGALYIVINDVKNGIKYLQKSLSLKTMIVGKYHSSLAYTYIKLAGLVSIENGKNSLLAKTEEIAIRSWGNEHLNTAKIFYTIAIEWSCFNDRQEIAMKYFELALKIYHLNLGEYHPEISDLQNRMAKIYNFNEEYKKANNLLEASLKGYIIFLVLTMSMSQQHMQL